MGDISNGERLANDINKLAAIRFKKFEDWFAKNIYELDPDDEKQLQDIWNKAKKRECILYINVGLGEFQYGTKLQVLKFINQHLQEIIDRGATLEAYDIVSSKPLKFKMEFQ